MNVGLEGNKTMRMQRLQEGKRFGWRTVTTTGMAAIAVGLALLAIRWLHTEQGLLPQSPASEDARLRHDGSPADVTADRSGAGDASSSASPISGGGAGGVRRRSSPAVGQDLPTKVLPAPQETEQALRNAIAAKDQQGLADILQRMHEDRDGHADVIRRLALDAEMPMFVRLAMVGLMREKRDAESLDALLLLSRDAGEPALRAEALKALGVRPETEAESRLREVAADTIDPGRAMALSLMGGDRGSEWRDVLLAVVGQGADAKQEELNAALYSLRHYRDEEIVETLLAVAGNQDLVPRLRATALYSLGVTGSPEALSAIKANLALPEREVRYAAVLASVRVSDADVSASLVGQLCDTGNFPHIRRES